MRADWEWLVITVRGVRSGISHRWGAGKRRHASRCGASVDVAHASLSAPADEPRCRDCGTLS